MSGIEKATKSTMIIIIISLISKGTGFLREVLIAAKFGAGYETDTYVLVMTATMFIISMIGTALNTTLIPMFVNIEEKKGKGAKKEYLNNILNIIILFSLAMIIVSWIFAPQIIGIFAKGFEGEQFKLAVNLNRIGLPIIIFTAISSIFIGFLQSDEQFLVPASTGVSSNFIYIIFLMFIGSGYGLKGLMYASILASLSQVLVQIPSIRRSGFKYSTGLSFKDENIKKILQLSGPVILGSSAQQINIMIDRTMSSSLAEGTLSSLNYAAKTSFIFTDVFIVAITTVIFPILSRAFSQDNIDSLKKIIIDGVKLIFFITVPASVGMIILANPIIKLLFERGAFNSNATVMTSQSLMFYCIAMTFTALKRLLHKVYYSLEDTKTPMINGLFEVVINIGFNIILVKYLAHRGLALSTSIAVIITSFTLFFNLNRKIGNIGLRNNLKYFIKIIISSTIMGISVYFCFSILSVYLRGSFFMELLSLSISVIIGIITYLLTCFITKVEEVKMIFNLINMNRRIL